MLICPASLKLPVPVMATGLFLHDTCFLSAKALDLRKVSKPTAHSAHRNTVNEERTRAGGSSCSLRQTGVYREREREREQGREWRERVRAMMGLWEVLTRV